MPAVILVGTAARRWRQERRTMAAVMAGKFHCPNCLHRGPHAYRTLISSQASGSVFVCCDCLHVIPQDRVPDLVIPGFWYRRVSAAPERGQPGE
jgi:hypothetical protein